MQDLVRSCKTNEAFSFFLVLFWVRRQRKNDKDSISLLWGQNLRPDCYLTKSGLTNSYFVRPWKRIGILRDLPSKKVALRDSYVTNDYLIRFCKTNDYLARFLRDRLFSSKNLASGMAITGRMVILQDLVSKLFNTVHRVASFGQNVSRAGKKQLQPASNQSFRSTNAWNC